MADMEWSKVVVKCIVQKEIVDGEEPQLGMLFL